jgi:hypothetical protein
MLSRCDSTRRLGVGSRSWVCGPGHSCPPLVHQTDALGQLNSDRGSASALSQSGRRDGPRADAMGPHLVCLFPRWVNAVLLASSWQALRSALSRDGEPRPRVQSRGVWPRPRPRRTKGRGAGPPGSLHPPARREKRKNRAATKKNRSRNRSGQWMQAGGYSARWKDDVRSLCAVAVQSALWGNMDSGQLHLYLAQALATSSHASAQPSSGVVDGVRLLAQSHHQPVGRCPAVCREWIPACY